MLCYIPEEATVQNSRGSLTAVLGRLSWGGDHMVLEDGTLKQPRGRNGEVLVPSGSFWRSNAELRNRTKGKSTHAHYADLYELELAGRHAQLFEKFDREEMRRLMGEQRDFSLFLLNYAATVEDERRERFALHMGLSRTLAMVRDSDKIAARAMMDAAFNLVDATGRLNPVAKAMQSGGAIGRFKTRRERAAAILAYEEWRTQQVIDAIDDHLYLHERLWMALSMAQRPGTTDVAERIFTEDTYLKIGSDNWLSDVRGKDGLKAAARVIQSYIDPLSTIQALPFRKNAAHVIKELTRAKDLCEQGNRLELVPLLRKTRRGLRWVFALQALQREVIFRLSLLLDALKKLRAVQVVVDDAGKRKFVIPRSAAPEHFALIEQALESVRTRIREKCNEQDLDHRIKKRVELYLGTAKEALATDNWKVAQVNLVKAARLM